ncbi:hypothetical protein D3C76_421020 [compost metagenome]
MDSYLRMICNNTRHAWRAACEFAHGRDKPGRAALAAALEEEEERSLAWVMQRRSPSALSRTRPLHVLPASGAASALPPQAPAG